MKSADQSVSITVDIEDWYHIPSVCGSPFSVYKDVDDFFSKWTGRYDYLTKPTERVLNILDRFCITATFFVVADVVEHYPGLVESIADHGHEIACHGLHHACKISPKTKNPEFRPDEFKERTLAAKKVLEKINKKDVIGYRAPNALVAGWMIDALEDMGFKYDSSVNVNSFFNKMGDTTKGVSTYPYYPIKNGLTPGVKREIVEFPWAHLDALAKIPTSGGPMLRLLGSHMILLGLEQSLMRGHTVFYFHPIDISTEQFPRIGHNRPGYWIIKGKVVEKRIINILKSLEHVKKITLSEVLGSLA